ncbi:unnamed protein product [Prorocentrum cordatum]|uniref:Uncharacterized protein n=1 Tax=Prorocentrum cordatum TaxID=2364126 RepID=A0ABN9PTI4_9DINO|nr:unnamed protein product [Polarella glacialis]
MEDVTVSSFSLGRGEQLSLLLGAAVAMVLSAVFLISMAIRVGGSGFYRALCCAHEPGDPATRHLIDEKLGQERRDSAKGIGTMVAFWGMVNCMLLIINHIAANPRWMTVGQDVSLIMATLLAVGSICWLQRTRKALVVSLVYVCFMLLSTCFVCFSSASQGLFLVVAIAAKFFQGLTSIAVTSPAVSVFMIMFHGVCVNFAYVLTEAPPCEEAFSMSQTTFAVSESLCGACIIVLTMLWKRSCILRISNELNWLISQSESVAARCLLNTICDATVELDENLDIVGSTFRLAAMLNHGPNRSLQGTSVVNFVDAADRDTFRDQLVSANAAAEHDLARVCNVRVRDSINNTFGVEMFIVCVASPMTSTSYLIGGREVVDFESKRMLASSAPHFRVAGPGPGPAEEGGYSASTPTNSEMQDPDEDRVAICFDACSDAFKIRRATHGFMVFLGRRDNCFLRWLRRSEVEPFVSWVQLTLNNMLQWLRQSDAGPSPEPAVYPEELHWRPRSMGKAGFGFASSVVLDLPPDQASATVVRITFTDVQLVRWASEPL